MPEEGEKVGSEASWKGSRDVLALPKKESKKPPIFSAGRPSKFDKEKLMASDGLIPLQSGSNRHASQKGMTGFGNPRDVLDHIKCQNLKELEDEEKIKLLKGSQRLQSGTNKFASQAGTAGFGPVRDVLYKPKGTGGASEVEEEKARATDGIIPLQSGTNKLASQAGMSMGAIRIIDNRKIIEQDRDSQGFIHLQMGTNKFDSQAGMTGMGMPRHNITKYKDEARGEMKFDETTLPKQTSRYPKGETQAGMTGFGAIRNTTFKKLEDQARKGQGMIPYQMGINFGDSQAGKTGFGAPRQVFTAYTDFGRNELPEKLQLMPEVPFWSGMETDFANQQGMSAMGTPRDVNGRFVHRLW